MFSKKPIIVGICILLGISLALDNQAQVLQNLVKNPSFEQYKEVPKDFGEIQQATYWSAANKAGADFYHERASNPSIDVPTNKMGRTNAKSGKGYGGFYAYTSRYSKRNFREYVQVELKHPMAAGDEYCIKAQVYLSESSNRAIGALGVTGSRTRVMKEHELPIDDLPFVYLLSADKSPLDDRKWVEISGTYKALGGEMYLIFGNFDDDRKSKVTGAIEIDSFRNPHVDFAYYIDNVCATSFRSNFTCDCGIFDYETNLRRERIVLDFSMKRKEYQLDEITILEDIQFEKDKASFKKGSEAALEDLLAVMKMNPTYYIEIAAHTNDDGDPKENQFLSKRRAKAVSDYLIAGGIDSERLSYRGFGQSRPIALNDTEEGRKQNERIQIKLLTK